MDSYRDAKLYVPISPSCIAHLLASNSVPDAAESRAATRHIEAPETQLASLEIYVLLHSRLQQLIAAHKSILSPIRRLPTELLVDIFAAAVQATFRSQCQQQDMSVGPPSDQAPWVFMRVCRRWAEAAIGARSLWSCFSLDLDRLGGLNLKGARMMKLLHERSGDMPLTIKIFGDALGLEQRRALDVIFPHAERWRNVDLHVDECYLPSITAALRGSLGNLTTLRIICDIEAEYNEIDADIAIRDTFADAPCLTALCARFYDSASTLLRSRLEFPWAQLTRLSTTFRSDYEAPPILRQLTSIMELQIEVIQHSEISIAAETPIVLPHLRLLGILLQEDEAQPENPSFLFALLQTPVLEHLLTCGTADDSAVLRLIERSGCSKSLTSLHFLHDYLEPSHVLPFLQKLPGLSFLGIGDFGGSLPDPSDVLQLGVSHWSTLITSRRPRLSVRPIDGGHVSREILKASAPMQPGLFIAIADDHEAYLSSKDFNMHTFP